MAGGRLRPYRLGDRAEHLVEHLLSAIAFVAPAPRQQDIGYDFFCSLISADGAMLKAGAFFTVQAKSSTKPLVYSRPHQVEWITSQQNPLLICVAKRKTMSVDVYSTWNLLCGRLAKGIPPRVELLPGVPRREWPGVEYLPDGTHRIHLGPPIAQLAIHDAYNDERAGQIGKVIGEWVALDRTNIVSTTAGMHWVIGPLSYNTGHAPPSDTQAVAFYWHFDNLGQSAINLGRAATSIALILRDAIPPRHPDRTAITKKEDAIRELLHTYWGWFDEGLRQFLIGQHLGPE